MSGSRPRRSRRRPRGSRSCWRSVWVSPRRGPLRGAAVRQLAARRPRGPGALGLRAACVVVRLPPAGHAVIPARRGSRPAWRSLPPRWGAVPPIGADGAHARLPADHARPQAETGAAVTLAADRLERHLFVSGATGTGKTAFLLALAIQMLDRGRGLLFCTAKHDPALPRALAWAAARRDRLGQYWLFDAMQPAHRYNPTATDKPLLLVRQILALLPPVRPGQRPPTTRTSSGSSSSPPYGR